MSRKLSLSIGHDYSVAFGLKQPQQRLRTFLFSSHQLSDLKNIFVASGTLLEIQFLSTFQTKSPHSDETLVKLQEENNQLKAKVKEVSSIC